MNNHISKLKAFPIAAIGLSLSLLTLSNAFNAYHITFLKPLAIIFSICALILLLIKIIAHPKVTYCDLTCPGGSPFYPTIDMVAFSLAASLLPYSPLIAKIIWILGVIFHLVYLVVFLYFNLKNDFKFEKVLPSWSVVVVGFCVAASSSTGFGFDKAALYLTYLGIIIYIIVYPILLYRIYIHKPALKEALAPTIGILAAPASLVLAAYLTVTHTPNLILFWFLAITGVINALLVYIALPKFLIKGFRLNYAAFTFPLAVSAVAALKASMYLKVNHYAIAPYFKIIADIEVILSALLIAYITIRFLIIFFKELVRKVN